MIHLLDVNVLIALADATHDHAEAALDFFETRAVREGWPTCPLTENAFLRILGNPKYPGGPGFLLGGAPGSGEYPRSAGTSLLERFAERHRRQANPCFARFHQTD